MKRGQQRGITLVVSLIMLIVLTLLVVSAIRFGNINLRIAGNAQAETESSAAAQVGLEKVMQLINAADDPAAVSAQNYNQTTGGTSYAVAVTKPVCIFSRNVLNTELNPLKPADKNCYDGGPSDPQFDADGNPIASLPACKEQQWDTQASVTDATSGAKVTVLQGASMRVKAVVPCP